MGAAVLFQSTRESKIGTLAGVLRQARVSAEEFIEAAA
jgi:hypothetical protein